MRHFCTLFNSAYQYHAHLLYNSLSEIYTEFELYFFCFDEKSLLYFKELNLPNIKLIYINDLEEKFPELKSVKTSRSVAEYFFTSTPATCKYVFEQYLHVDEIVYLDADIFFYQSPEPIFDEISNYSVSIIPHRFNWLNYGRNVFGYYNVGWVSFKKDKDGIACLNNWYNNNIEWCFDKLTLTKYADQKYLNYWVSKFNNVRVIKNIGANVAPWNIGRYKITIENNQLFINKHPLIFYHFASLKLIDESFYTTISSYFFTVKPSIKKLIYIPYIISLKKLGFVPKASVRLNKNYFINIIRNFTRSLFNDFINT